MLGNLRKASHRGNEKLDDASDDMLFGWIAQDHDLFSLADAGYQFTISMSATNLPLPQPLWCERRTSCRRANKTKHNLCPIL
jgi:hypothetical protein